MVLCLKGFSLLHSPTTWTFRSATESLMTSTSPGCDGDRQQLRANGLILIQHLSSLHDHSQHFTDTSHSSIHHPSPDDTASEGILGFRIFSKVTWLHWDRASDLPYSPWASVASERAYKSRTGSFQPSLMWSISLWLLLHIYRQVDVSIVSMGERRHHLHINNIFADVLWP